MAWSGKVYPSFRLDSDRESAIFRRALARRQVREYLGLDECARRIRWLELGLFYYRLTVCLEYYQALPEGAERCALRPVLAEAMLHLGDCRAALSDRHTADGSQGEGAVGFLGDSFLPPL